jgi:hypothetical protein
MASAPNSMPNDPRPSGDLEHLFRQTFAEAEIQPRTNLWEQLDHELVVQQNDTYRKRLTVHRWVAAACLLLALGFGGWAAMWQLNKGNGGPIASASDARSSRSQSGLGTATAAVDGSAASVAKGERAGGSAQPGTPGEAAGLLATGPLGQSEVYGAALGAADDVYAAASTSRQQAYPSGRLGSYAAAGHSGVYSHSGSLADGSINYGFASQGQHGGAPASDNLLSLSRPGPA